MFCGKGFAVGLNAGRYSGYAAVATMDNVIAAIAVAPKLVEHNEGRRTSATGKLSKENLIREIDREPIEKGWQQFPLWIKVPLKSFLLATSSRRP
jgi:hypothetical protein